ncbi:Xanthine/uracil permease [Planifilum fulgidum]|uniref:Xanthine/uracil permease n=1 Tax=Planifilum fulgidum TaxID=201973 RepID=A0A1I2M8L4_9BACL|nr:purine/pyrimidine permease [Planifilum fulgidum]SFF87802.1 Xanthine/uracil permease [Planifilum fulgidum]
MENSKVRRWGAEAIAAVQWLIFLVANTVALPVVIGEIFQFTSAETAALMQRTFLVVAVGSLLQGWLGHRLPLMDGPAGIWMGVFAILGSQALARGSDAREVLQSLEGAMLVTGGCFLILSMTGWMKRLLPLFTPLVTGTYLLLLVSQLSGIFFQGMLTGANGGFDPLSAWTALGVFFLVLLLSAVGKGWWKSYAMLIGMLAGWILFSAFGRASGAESSAGSPLPTVLEWGPPHIGMESAITGILVAFVLLSNMVASLAAVGEAVRGRSDVDIRELTRGGWVSGINHGLSALFSTGGMVPLSVSAGFVRLTGERGRGPFLIACLLMIGVSLVPPWTEALASIPGPVVYAALLASFVQMAGTAVRTVMEQPLDERRATIFGISLVLGIGTMFLPTPFFETFPPAVRYVLENGLLVGTLAVFFLERIWRKRLPSNPAGNNGDQHRETRLKEGISSEQVGEGKAEGAYR